MKETRCRCPLVSKYRMFDNFFHYFNWFNYSSLLLFFYCPQVFNRLSDTWFVFVLAWINEKLCIFYGKTKLLDKLTLATPFFLDTNGPKNMKKKKVDTIRKNIKLFS